MLGKLSAPREKISNIVIVGMMAAHAVHVVMMGSLKVKFRVKRYYSISDRELGLLQDSVENLENALRYLGR